MGKLLDRWWTVLLAYRPAIGRIHHHSRFRRYYPAGRSEYNGLFFSIRLALGCWWAYLWVGRAVLGRVVGQQHHLGTYHGIRFTGAIHLLLFQWRRGERNH